MDLLTLHIIHNNDDYFRLDRLKKELFEQGIDNFFLWDAVYDERGTYQGINKAHKQIVQWAKENNLPFVTIAEDDIKFFDKSAYRYYLNSEPKEYDLYLGGIFLGEIDENNETKRFTGLSLYRVHHNYYDIFLSAEENEHLDIALGYARGKFVVCNPFAVRQHNGYSTNEKRYMNYDFIFSERKIYREN